MSELAEQPYVASIRFLGVHGHLLLQAGFKPGLNILHGKNGTGKTTLLHILANLFEADLLRFCSIRFECLTFHLSDGKEIKLEQFAQADRVAVRVTLGGENLGALSKGAPVPDSITKAFKQLFPKRPVYLPAFRSILEAATNREDYRIYYESPELRGQMAQVEIHERQDPRKWLEPNPSNPFGRSGTTAAKTVLSRRWFGDFVPIIRYPSLADVSQQLTDEAQNAYVEVNQSNQATFSTVFSDVLKAVQQGLTPKTQEDVQNLLSRVKKRMQAITPSQASAAEDVSSQPWRPHDEKSFRAVLEIYDNALRTRDDKEARAYSRLRIFEESIDRFIQPKKLRVSQPGDSPRRGPRVLLSNEQSEKLEVLSSGERQVLTMLFCATHMSDADGVMLIDEPEISLHVDWQRIILDEIIKQAANRQIIACTHAPEVVAEHHDALVLLDSTQQQSGLFGARVEDDGEVNEGA